MKFGLFYEHNLPRPWTEDSEAVLFKQVLEQVELADRLGFHAVWQVEHHFLEEYAHSAAPEVLLAAYSQRTKNIRLGHGIVQTPPHYNHPARIAERVATLDLVSGGRVEFGTGESSSEAEMGGFNLKREEKRAAWKEGTEAALRMMVEEPFTGYKGEFLDVPTRNVVPKPIQKPHPPVWAACSQRDTIHFAAQHGIGALSFAFVTATEAKQWVDDYYSTVENESIPIGYAVNPNVAIVTPLMCCESEEEAKAKGEKGVNFFGYALAHYYVFGTHKPGRTNIWQNYEKQGDMFSMYRMQQMNQSPDAIRGCVGTPEHVRQVLLSYEEAGVDQVIFFSQAGHNRHEDICESYELTAEKVLPEFLERDAALEDERSRRREDINEKALARKQAAPETAPPHDEKYEIKAPGAGTVF
jgi:alkanesulfonate monooxygenase SsuD/methylene tetrahydromethanopterin reductase-like flavin-dependent oxidoreductase (luciferase family)